VFDEIKKICKNNESIMLDNSNNYNLFYNFTVEKKGLEKKN